MKCKKIQVWLKSDYLDGELNSKETVLVREHLKGCPYCRQLEEELKAKSVLFKNSNVEIVPECVWNNIHNAIVTENFNKEAAGPGILGQLRELIWNRKPVFVLANAFGLILFITVIAGTLIHKRQTLANGEDVFEEYSLNSENGDFIYGFGTDTEEYFL
ncbi:MAG: anti-sigma factor [Candidatus Omnitrophota bacterium]|jgi:anti-sigma factor RsiW